MIIGTGIDIIECHRIKKQINNAKFIDRILTIQEKQRFNQLSDHRKVEFLAGRFAAKEAYAKAKGTGIGKALSWRDIEVMNNSQGKPILKDMTNEKQVIHLSITHTEMYAAAFVIIESE
ncbi:holo-[acyl-carrier protein] synthase [Scopulibacillus daqui]|uniref:Holo-[acyl-carrier-protein] synthase n=1 Tax=Scopulibacillus daqui TaxID=1469162 RepID=A0ABS2PX80_9BACL|nr:holo-ACP synthase [Scopulibacillus daqui]MBM7644669.1 holo-[acyl-carrier protein] synthase [Scopulibacillus daqui]